MERESRAPKSVSCGHPRLSRPSSPSHKKNLLSFFQKLWFISPHPDSVRGADASSRTRGGMRWTRRVSRDERHSICGRRSRVVPAPRCRCQVSRIFREATVTTKPGLTGEITEKVVKPSRRECSGRKTTTKSTVRAACVLRCVAIRGNHDFSTTYLWKPAQARCGRPVCPARNNAWPRRAARLMAAWSLRCLFAVLDGLRPHGSACPL